MTWRALVVGIAGALCLAAASDPADRLPDPAQEAQARSIFRDVRCLVCQNESIDDSQAELAADLRKIVREQVSAGRSDGEIKQFLIERYGEFAIRIEAVTDAGKSILDADGKPLEVNRVITTAETCPANP